MVQCNLCPRACKLEEGKLGICGVRKNVGGVVVHADYGILSAIHVDPIEKKPLHHYYPGARALSIGSFGCNLFCRGCQNDSISRKTAGNMDGFKLKPSEIVSLANKHSCPIVAYTYNEPIVWAEFMGDTAAVVREAGLKNVIVTAGYVSDSQRSRVFENIDAANVDLKGFSEKFYRSWAKAELKPVLDTLEYLHEKENFWLEITTLLIPGINDGRDELEAEFAWISEHLGNDVPLHLSAFHPACEATDIPRTPVETIISARELAWNAGLKYVYAGNVSLEANTVCPNCRNLLVQRRGFDAKVVGLYQGCCCQCGTKIRGVWKG